MTTTRPAALAAVIVLRDQAVAARWTRDHGARLVFVLSRPELRAAWTAISLTLPSRGHRPRRAQMAQDLAAHDAALLAGERPGSPWLEAERVAAVARVRAVGTPTWWAGQHVDAATACPMRPAASPAHRWTGVDPVCVWCGVVIGQPNPVDRGALATAVWRQVARHHGLSRQQVADAIDVLGDLVDARRGLPVPARRPRPVRPRPAPTPRPVSSPSWRCVHLWTAVNPVCRRCGAVIGDVAPVDRRELAHQVWVEVARRYGLTMEQTARAVRGLGDLIDAHRGMGAPRPTGPTGATVNRQASGRR